MELLQSLQIHPNLVNAVLDKITGKILAKPQHPCNVPKIFIASQWPNHIFHIHESCQIDAKGQIIAKKENH